jgi:DnaK suppressor protein
MVLTAEGQQRYRDRLTQERERIEAEIANLGNEIAVLGEDQQVEGGGGGNHLADDATDVMEQERDLALIGNLQERRRDVDRALERLDAGTYGICERCGKPIAPERLEALPFATLCIECKAIEDRQRRPAML